MTEYKYRDHELIKNAKEAFINDHELAPTEIRPEILESWRRTVAYDISKVSLKAGLLSQKDCRAG